MSDLSRSSSPTYSSNSQNQTPTNSMSNTPNSFTIPKPFGFGFNIMNGVQFGLGSSLAHDIFGYRINYISPDKLSNNSVSLELLDNYVPNPECELAYSEYKFCRERSNYRCDCGVAKQNFLYCEERVKESNSKTT